MNSKFQKTGVCLVIALSVALPAFAQSEQEIDPEVSFIFAKMKEAVRAIETLSYTANTQSRINDHSGGWEKSSELVQYFQSGGNRAVDRLIHFDGSESETADTFTSHRRSVLNEEYSLFADTAKDDPGIMFRGAQFMHNNPNDLSEIEGRQVRKQFNYDWPLGYAYGIGSSLLVDSGLIWEIASRPEDNSSGNYVLVFRRGEGENADHAEIIISPEQDHLVLDFKSYRAGKLYQHISSVPVQLGDGRWFIAEIDDTVYLPADSEGQQAVYIHRQMQYENVEVNQQISNDKFGLDFINFKSNAYIERYDQDGSRETYLYNEEYNGLLPEQVTLDIRRATSPPDLTVPNPEEPPVPEAEASASSPPNKPPSSQSPGAKPQPNHLAIYGVIALIIPCVTLIIFYFFKRTKPR